MPPTDAEIIAARLSRMKGLIDALEKACSANADLTELFRKLREELKAAREALKIVPSP